MIFCPCQILAEPIWHELRIVGFTGEKENRSGMKKDMGMFDFHVECVGSKQGVVGLACVLKYGKPSSGQFFPHMSCTIGDSFLYRFP